MPTPGYTGRTIPTDDAGYQFPFPGKPCSKGQSPLDSEGQQSVHSCSSYPLL